MALIARRSARSPARRRGGFRTAAASLAVGLAVTGAGCGMDAQTLQPYTPADGVNVDVGAVQVRNLMILSRQQGTGFLSATLTATDRDALTAVAGAPYQADGSPGAAFTVQQPNPVSLGPNTLVVLTNRSLITLASPDLVIGNGADLTLTFSTAGDTTIKVPIVNADQPDYATISPSPSPSGSR